MAYVPEKDRHYILGTTLYNLVDDIVETSRRNFPAMPTVS